MISKQAAIEAILGVTTYKSVEEIKDQCNEHAWADNGWTGGVRDAIEAIEDMDEEESEPEEGKNCGNCKWLSDDFTLVCVNVDSEHRADFVDGETCCDKWEAMKADATD
ncbi:MAG: hypothetical protein IJ188_03005 [Clostridia bacterium]|nr:hypothetical protein [Clostridia bacterium]